MSGTVCSLDGNQRSVLAERYAGLVRHIARRMLAGLPGGVELDDLIQDGSVGLMDALHRFDPSKGVQFQTYASNRIRGAILDAQRSRDWASRGARRRGRELRQAEEQLHQQLGRTPSPEDLAGFTGLDCKEVARRRQESHLLRWISLEQQRGASEENRASLLDSLVDGEVNLEAQIAAQDRRAVLVQALRGLSERERQILALYYFEELTLREIGSLFGVSEARICQIHGRCLRKLKEALEPGLGLAS